MTITKTEIEPVVLCHGLYGSLYDPTMLSHFGESNVLAPDLLGYGEYTSCDVSNLSLVDQAEHVLAVMDRHSVRRANLVGHSVGGVADQNQCIISLCDDRPAR